MPQAEGQRYDRIGSGYARQRRPDPHLRAAIWDALGDAESVANVGAGAGSYEPEDRHVVAVEPSLTMLGQRPLGSARAVRSCAEALPFRSGSFDAALAVLTIHHWRDWRAGLREMVRISRRRVVLFTWDPQSEGSWLDDYFPGVVDADRLRFPMMGAIREILGEATITNVRIPYDCTDGFMGAYWRRPAAYLDRQVRGAISSLATEASSEGLTKLADDVGSGEWERRYGAVLDNDELDLGYRLVMGSSPGAGC